jgi:hypothetical protein
MKQVTRNSVDCFLNKGNRRFDNTLIETVGNISKMYLFGNLIAKFDHSNNELSVSNAGWFSNTTKERLNALPNVRIHQHKWLWYLNGNQWNGEFIKI